MSRSTSWGSVADWWSDHLESSKETYQAKVILPNLLRLLHIETSERILDLACGQGFFSREFSKAGAGVYGVDISPELIHEAKRLSPPHIKYLSAPAEDLKMFKQGFFNKAVCVLAIQNIKDVSKALKEAARVLVPSGKFYIVMNHPAFRIPEHSGWDFKDGRMQRVMDSYLSESSKEIVAHPGQTKSAKTISFHRPLQWYFKIFAGTGFATTRLEEWISHKNSQAGPKQKEEDRARKEFPLFLCLELEKRPI